MLKFGSVCSGIEAASVAWHSLGWKAAWVAEIEKFPSAVLAHHYPEVPNLGDMTDLPESIVLGLVEAPDVLCGGTPCQAFSVAGLRRSLDDARGNLSLVFCEIANAIDAARLADDLDPAIIFWENVPGVLSTKDNAFGCFLAGLAGEDDPLDPPGGKWAYAGVVSGPTRTVAWRVLDAQYFGVAQRRRRVFVVASARADFDPVAVLFEFDGLRRDTAPSRKARQVAPTIPARSTAGGGLGADFDCDGGLIPSVTGALACNTGPNGHDAGNFACNQGVDAGYVSPVVAQCVTTGTGRRYDPETETILPVAMRESGHGYWIEDVVSGTLDASMGQSGHANRAATIAVPVLPFDTTQITSAANYSNPKAGDPCHPLAAGAHAPAIALAYSVRTANTGANGWGIQEEVTHTLDTTQGPAIAFVQNSRDEVRLMGGDGDIVGALAAETGAKQQCYVALGVALRGREGGATAELGDEVGGCLRASSGGGDKPHVLTAMQVRRLTPTECERLQGFPDGYTQIPWRGKAAADCPDGPRYKALGNSWAVPNVRWIGDRINSQLLDNLL